MHQKTMQTVFNLVIVIFTFGELQKSQSTLLATLNDGHDSNEATRVEVVTTYMNVSLQSCIAYSVGTDNDVASANAMNFMVTDHHSKLGVCTTVVTSLSLKDKEEGSCYSNPCKFHGKCIPKEDHDFQCECQYPMGGKTCEDLVCKQCYRNNDFVILLDTTIPSVNWKDSYHYCRERNMTLLIDDDPVKHDFVYNILTKLYPDRKTQVAFWIGLKRASPDVDFEYVDEVDPSKRRLSRRLYSRWAKNRPQKGHCVELPNGDEYDWKWYDDVNCNVVPEGWLYYPLCEKSL